MRPLISVIIPTYNRTELLLNRALPSVFGQIMDDQEVLVVGDGTEEETVTALSNDPRVRFWNLPHYPYPESHELAWGIYGLEALNWGLDHAQGEWIAVLGDDDEFTPNHHATLLTAAERTGADHVYGISMTVKYGIETGQKYGTWPPGDGAFCNGANIYRASLGYRYDLTCTQRGITGDADLWTRMRNDGVKFHMENRLVHRYHRNWP